MNLLPIKSSILLAGNCNFPMILICPLSILVFYRIKLVFMSINAKNTLRFIVSTILIVFLPCIVGIFLLGQLLPSLYHPFLKITSTNFLILPISLLKVPLNMKHWKIKRVSVTEPLFVSLCTVM